MNNYFTIIIFCDCCCYDHIESTLFERSDNDNGNDNHNDK